MAKMTKRDTPEYWLELLVDVEALRPSELLDAEYVKDRVLTNVANQGAHISTKMLLDVVAAAAVFAQLEPLIAK